MCKKKSMHLSSICIVVCFVMFVYFTNIKVSEGIVDDKDTVRHDMSPERCASNKNNDNARKTNVQVNHGRLPLYFIENRGQVDKRVRFYEKGSGRAMYFTERGVYLSLTDHLEDRSQKTEARGRNLAGQAHRLSSSVILRNKITKQSPNSESVVSGVGLPAIHNPQSEIVRLFPLGANKNPGIVAEGLLEGKVNYLIGNDPGKWKTNVPTYQTIIYKNVYKDIDMKFYGNNRQMEYDIIVKPGANPSHVQLSYQGIENLRITNDGDLEVRLKDGCLIQKKPYVYQEIEGKRVVVDGKFKVLRSRSGVKNQKMATVNPKPKTLYPPPDTCHSSLIYGFQVASYDKRYPLVIDPALYYSTYLGGSDDDYCAAVAVDDEGNAYITGYTFSPDFPTTPSLYGTNTGSGRYSDAFVTRLNGSNTSLAYSTYLGGIGEDVGLRVDVDQNGNAYVTGYTYSPDFPTVSARYVSNAGGYDAFVARLNGSGTADYSTYLGGSTTDAGTGITVDDNENVYVAGFTDSLDFPTASALYENNAGGYDAFVTKLNGVGTNVVYSTYFGGGSEDVCWGIAGDDNGTVYITGYTYSSDFPTVSAIYGSNTGGYDAFVAAIKTNELDPGGMVYSTYLGGSDTDVGYGIALDASGNAYVTGYTYSTDFKTVSNSYKTDLNNGLYSDAFVAKLNGSGTSLIYSTYLGGSGADTGYGIALDASGNTYVTGYTDSNDFPVEPALSSNSAGRIDAFITELNDTGSGLEYSTYWGGSDDDYGYGVALNEAGNVCVAGNTYSEDFPVASALYETNTGRSDVFVTMLTKKRSPTVTTTSATEVNRNSAKLTGMVNANGLDTTAWFEYGTTKGEETKTFKIEQIDGSTPLYINTSIQISIDELPEETTYYYELVAGNDEGTRTGGVKEFTTSYCDLESIELSKKRIQLKRGSEREITVTVRGKDTGYGNNDCEIVGAEVIVEDLDENSEKLVTVSLKNGSTDENGEIKFTITAKNKLGIAVVKFKIKDTGLEKRLTIRVVR